MESTAHRFVLAPGLGKRLRRVAPDDCRIGSASSSPFGSIANASAQATITEAGGGARVTGVPCRTTGRPRHPQEHYRFWRNLLCHPSACVPV